MLFSKRKRNVKLKAGLYLFLLLLSIIPLMNVRSARADDTTYDLSISGLKDYYLRGETVSGVIITNYKSCDLSVLAPNGKYYSLGVIEANTTFSYAIPSNAIAGTYTLIAEAGNLTAKAWFTVLDTSNLSFQPLPYKVTHKGVTYIFFANWTVRIIGKTGSFTLNFTLFKMLAKTFDLKVEVYSNDMIFRATITDPLKLVNLQFIWMFIHRGCKFVIKGKLPTSMTFPIKLQKIFNLKRSIHQVRCGNLVFDWSDLARTKQTFSYDAERKALWITVPKSFVLDPYIFEDGFESGDFSAWDSTYVTSGDTLQVTSSTSHSGSYCMEYGIDNPDTDVAYAVKGLGSSYTTIHVRLYAKVASSTLSATSYVGFLILRDQSEGKTRVSLRWFGDGHLGIGYRKDGVWNTAESTTTMSTGAWHCLEVKCVIDSTNGEYRVWLDGTEVSDLTQTGIDTTTGSTSTLLRVGNSGSAGSGSVTIYEDDVVVADSYIGPLASNNAPSIGALEATSSVYANQYFTVNCTVNDADGASDIENVTLNLGNGVVLKWDNDTNSFSESQDSNNYCTLNASACSKTSINSSAFKLSFNLKLNNYPAGTVSVTGTVYDSAGANGTKTESSLFTLSYPTLTLQARDADGNNLPIAVTFKGTLGNGTSFTANSNSNGLKQLTTCYGTHTINVWWGTHLIGTATTSVTSSKTVNIDTKIRKATFGSDYLLASLNNTDLPAPTVISGTEVKFAGVTASGTIQLKLDVSHWHVQDEPVKVQVGSYIYERGASGWSWDSVNKIWSFNVHFSTQDIIIYWEETTTSDGGGSSGGASTTTQIPAEPETEETATPTVPAQPTIPESYVIYKSPFTVDTTMVAVGLIVICVVVYLANHYLSNYGSVSKLWRKRLERKRRVKWKK